MPQPRAPSCPRRGLHSRASWQPMCESTGQHRRSAECPGQRTRSALSNSAPTAYRNTQISFGVCTDHRRDRDRRTAYSAATHQSRPPNRHQNNPGRNRGPAQGERTPRPARPNGPNRSGPSTIANRSSTEAEGPSMPIFHAGGTCRHAPRMARQRRSTGSIRSHA